MTQRNKAGMRLRQVPNPRQKDRLWLLQTAVFVMATMVLALTVTGLTGFRTGSAPVVMLVVSVCLGATYGILVKTRQESWFYIAMLLLVLALTLICRKQILEGFRVFWNQVSDTMVHSTGWVLPEWELQLDAEHSGLCSALLASLFACLLAFVCSVLLSFAPALLAVLLPVMLIGGMTIFHTDAGFFWLLPVLGISVLILAYSGWMRNGAAAPIVMNWIICAIVAGVLILVALLPGVQIRTAQVCEDVHHAIHEKKYETKYTTLPEGDFNDFAVTVQKPKQALAVTMEVPQQMYLRGFTGAVFEDNRWKGLPKADLAKNKQLLYWLNQSAFDKNAQYDTAAAYTQLPQSTVSVQNIGACSFYRYVPYSIGKGTWTQPENLNTNGVYGNGERSYVYSVAAGSSEQIMQVLTHLQTSDDPAVLQYRKAESGYRKFIYQYYLQVPQAVRELLQEQWDAVAARYGTADNLTLQQAEECVLIFLGRCFPKEGTPAEIELPLATLEGTSYQYATVAAMTLRYYGVPARYAEGYVISQEMAAESKSGEPITVDSSCGKAWVEVYQDGIGWIPMDLTIGMGEILESAENTGKNQGDSQMPQEEEKKKNEEPEPQEQPEPTGGTMVQVLLKTVLTGVVSILLVLALVFVALWIRRKYLLCQKEKKFGSSNCADAVAWIYADTALLLEKLGFDRGNGSMRSLQCHLEEKFGAEFATHFGIVSDLNDRAMFSSIPMDDQQRKALRKFHSWTLRKLNTEVKWYKRMWLKWVRCLY